MGNKPKGRVKPGQPKDKRLKENKKAIPRKPKKG